MAQKIGSGQGSNDQVVFLLKVAALPGAAALYSSTLNLWRKWAVKMEVLLGGLWLSEAVVFRPVTFGYVLRRVCNTIRSTLGVL